MAMILVLLAHRFTGALFCFAFRNLIQYIQNSIVNCLELYHFKEGRSLSVGVICFCYVSSNSQYLDVINIRHICTIMIISLESQRTSRDNCDATTLLAKYLIQTAINGPSCLRGFRPYLCLRSRVIVIISVVNQIELLIITTDVS